MRILQLTAFYLPSQGGMQYYVRNLSQALTDRGHEVAILTVNTDQAPAREERPEGTVYRCALDFNYHRGLISRELIGRLFAQRGYDALHVHIPFPLGLEIAVLAARRRGTPVVVTHHGTGTKDDRLYTVIAGVYDKIYRNLSLRGAGQIVFLTESYRDEVPLPAPLRQRTQVVRTGADVARFSPAVNGGPVRAQYGFSADDTVGLWVGSLNEHNRYKGLNYLVEALARDAAAPLKMLIVGDGPLRAELQTQAAGLGLHERLRFAGAVENGLLPDYYAAADFFVLPSIRGPENSPVVVYEAMASGKAVLASDLPGVREIVRDGQTGVLVPPRDVAALAAALGRLIADPAYGAALGQAGRARALAQSWDNCAAQFEGIYAALHTPLSPAAAPSARRLS